MFYLPMYMKFQIDGFLKTSFALTICVICLADFVKKIGKKID